MTASLLPEGCLLCCPALLKSWRAGARCCCVHWRLPSAAFPAHRSFVCQREGERGRRGRSEIMVVNVLKKTCGGQLCTGYEWKDGGTEIFSDESSNLLRVSPTQTGLLTRGMSLHFHLNIHVVRPAIEGQKKKKNPPQAIFAKLCSSSIWNKIQFREEIYFCHSLLRFNRYEMSLRAASLS